MSTTSLLCHEPTVPDGHKCKHCREARMPRDTWDMHGECPARLRAALDEAVGSKSQPAEVLRHEPKESGSILCKHCRKGVRQLDMTWYDVKEECPARRKAATDEADKLAAKKISDHEKIRDWAVRFLVSNANPTIGDAFKEALEVFRVALVDCEKCGATVAKTDDHMDGTFSGRCGVCRTNTRESTKTEQEIS